MEAFYDKFFDWWSHQILVIEDYPYAGIDFSRDPDMVVPPGAVQGELGKFLIFIDFNFYFLLYISFLFFLCTRVFGNDLFVMHRTWDQCFRLILQGLDDILV
jgi:hypothetical protein